MRQALQTPSDAKPKPFERIAAVMVALYALLLRGREQPQRNASWSSEHIAIERAAQLEPVSTMTNRRLDERRHSHQRRAFAARKRGDHRVAVVRDKQFTMPPSVLIEGLNNRDAVVRSEFQARRPIRKRWLIDGRSLIALGPSRSTPRSASKGTTCSTVRKTALNGNHPLQLVG